MSRPTVFWNDKTLDPEAKTKAKANDMTSYTQGSSRPRPWPRGLHLCISPPSPLNFKNMGDPDPYGPAARICCKTALV